MSILSDFFIASPEDALNFDGGSRVAEEDKCQYRRLTPLEAGGMLAALRGAGDPVDLMDEFRFLTPEDAEEWTLSVPDDMVRILAALAESEIPVVARKFAEATHEELEWSQEDFEPVVQSLRTLAQRAEKSGKKMYMWNCL